MREGENWPDPLMKLEEEGDLEELLSLVDRLLDGEGNVKVLVDEQTPEHPQTDASPYALVAENGKGVTHGLLRDMSVQLPQTKQQPGSNIPNFLLPPPKIHQSHHQQQDSHKQQLQPHSVSCGRGSLSDARRDLLQQRLCELERRLAQMQAAAAAGTSMPKTGTHSMLETRSHSLQNSLKQLHYHHEYLSSGLSQQHAHSSLYAQLHNELQLGVEKGAAASDPAQQRSPQHPENQCHHTQQLHVTMMSDHHHHHHHRQQQQHEQQTQASAMHQPVSHVQQVSNIHQPFHKHQSIPSAQLPSPQPSHHQQFHANSGSKLQQASEPTRPPTEPASSAEAVSSSVQQQQQPQLPQNHRHLQQQCSKTHGPHADAVPAAKAAANPACQPPVGLDDDALRCVSQQQWDAAAVHAHVQPMPSIKRTSHNAHSDANQGKIWEDGTLSNRAGKGTEGVAFGSMYEAMGNKDLGGTGGYGGMAVKDGSRVKGRQEGMGSREELGSSVRQEGLGRKEEIGSGGARYGGEGSREELGSSERCKGVDSPKKFDGGDSWGVGGLALNRATPTGLVLEGRTREAHRKGAVPKGFRGQAALLAEGHAGLGQHHHAMSTSAQDEVSADTYIGQSCVQQAHEVGHEQDHNLQQQVHSTMSAVQQIKQEPDGPIGPMPSFSPPSPPPSPPARSTVATIKQEGQELLFKPPSPPASLHTHPTSSTVQHRSGEGASCHDGLHRSASSCDRPPLPPHTSSTQYAQFKATDSSPSPQIQATQQAFNPPSQESLMNPSRNGPLALPIPGNKLADRQAPNFQHEPFIITDRNGSLVNMGDSPEGGTRQGLQGTGQAPIKSFQGTAVQAPRDPFASPSAAKGLQLWTGNRSQAQVAKLGVRLIQANDLSRSSHSKILDPFATVKCEKAKFATKTIAKSKQPYWDDFFVFEVRSPAFAVLRVKVLDHLSCWRPALVGEVRVPIKFLAENSVHFAQPAWHSLHQRKGHASHGQIQMQCFYLQERVHRPLHVMCCTWNVGNAAPPDDLSPWLKGVNESTYDIVAIGVQECSYKLKGSVKDENLEPGDVESLREKGSMSFDPRRSVSTLRQGITPSPRHTSEAGGGASPSSQGLSRLTLQVDSRVSSTTSTLNQSVYSPGGTTAQSYIADAAGAVHESLQENSMQQQQQHRKFHRGQAAAQGTQQKKSLKEVDVGGGRIFQKAWEDHIKAAMGGHYWMARSVHMGQIRLLLFARNDMYAAISNIEKGSQATGVGGVATNKGAVAIAIQVWDTEICFINCHLAAHQDKTHVRNAQYSDIVKGIRMSSSNMDVLNNYHHVFWMGDLNYRLDYNSQANTPTKSAIPAEHAALVADVNAKKWSELLATDQLRKEQGAARAFLRFQESSPSFPPTFKVERRKGTHYKTQRLPAWCDRVLFRSNLPLKQVKAQDYLQVPEIGTSDHKPVAAIFTVPTVWRQDSQMPTHKVHLAVHCLRITGLVVDRKRRASSSETTSHSTRTLPNPQVILMGVCLSGKGVHRTGVAQATTSPLWDMASNLPLKPAAIQDLAHRRLLVRVVDVVRDGLGKGQTTTLARGVLPLTSAAMKLLQCSGKQMPGPLSGQLQGAAPLGGTGPYGGPPQTAKIEVPLEYNGLPAGTLFVEMALEVDEVQPSKKSASSQSLGPHGLFNRMSFRAAVDSDHAEQDVSGSDPGNPSSAQSQHRNFFSRISIRMSPAGGDHSEACKPGSGLRRQSLLSRFSFKRPAAANKV